VQTQKSAHPLIKNVASSEQDEESQVTHHVSIRGWLECPHESFDLVRDAQAQADDTIDRALDGRTNGLSGGWIYPALRFNWSAYIFFGLSIPDSMRDGFRIQLEAMIRAEPNLDGLFWLDGDHCSHSWRVNNGTITEQERRTIDANMDSVR
jgi:hypothetical protein